MSSKPFQCLSCRLKQAASRLTQPANRQFHSSPASNARSTFKSITQSKLEKLKPAYPEVKQANEIVLKARRKQVQYLASHLKPYTDQEKKLLASRYTPDQMAAIEAGEAAINPSHLVSQGKIRADAFRPTYIDDFATERPLLDTPPAKSQHGDPIPGSLESQIAEDADPSTLRLSQQSGLTTKDIGAIPNKVLVRHRVVNQTRMGKIRSIYVLSIAGNLAGMVGIGEGKSAESPDATAQSLKNAIRNMKPVPRYEERTIYGEVEAKVGASVVQLSARPPGFGNRAQHLIYELTRLAGISDLAARTPRSRNKMNVVKAAFKALTSQRLPEDVARSRGRKMVDVRSVYYGGNLS